MTAKQLVKMMEDKGWYFIREGKGSHRIYGHKNKDYHISVPFHGSEDIAKGLLNKLLKQAGLK